METIRVRFVISQNLEEIVCKEREIYMDMLATITTTFVYCFGNIHISPRELMLKYRIKSHNYWLIT